MALKHYAMPLAGGKTEFVWQAGSLSKGINLKNTGKIRFEVLDKSAANQGIGIYGTDDPGLITNSWVPNIGSFVPTTVGQVAELELDKTYSRIIVWSVYNTNGWSATLSIST